MIESRSRKSEDRRLNGQPLLCVALPVRPVVPMSPVTHIAKYLTALPPRKLLEKRLKEAVELARARFGDGALPVGKRLQK